MPDPNQVLSFWWKSGPEAWFGGDASFDEACREHCGDAFEAARAGGLESWRDAPHAMLALILLLDQMPRNMFRDTPRMFETDSQALLLAEESLAREYHLAYPHPARRFFYMPFMHAENLAAQTRCIDLCRADGDSDGYHYALVHMDPIRRFGRFPHRNAILGRASSPQEEAYLNSGGFGG